MPAARKKQPAKSGKPRKRKGVRLKPTALKANQLGLDRGDLDTKARTLIAQLEADGGSLLAVYREPLGGHAQLLAALPIEQVEPTPFQRDVSDGHVRKLTLAMDRTRRFLDPIIAVYKDGKYLTPNGNHRLTALKELDAKTILALLIPDVEVAYQILALNTEKAHNLREKALEVYRMYEELARLDGDRSEESFALEFEEPQLITLGFAYAERGRLAGGAYQPALKKVDGFLRQPLAKALKERQRRAELVLKFDEAVSDAVQKLKDRGMQSPYLKSFVVARVNPLRFIKGEFPSFDELLATMTRRARGMDPARVKTEDLSRAGGVPDAEGE